MFNLTTKEEATARFENQYSGIINELRGMPNDDKNKGKNSKRWSWFKQQPDYDDMVFTLMNGISPKGLANILSFEQNPEKTKNPDAGLAMHGRVDADGRERRDIDPAVFMDTLVECVNWYNGVSKSGESFHFTQYVIKRYGQLAGRDAAKRAIEPEGITGGSDSDDKRMPALLKLVKELKNILLQSQVSGEKYDFDAALEQCLSQKGKYAYTRDEIRSARDIVEKFNVIRLEDYSIENAEGDSLDWEEMIPDASDPYEDSFSDSVFSGFGEKWDNIIEAATFRTDRNLLKAFLAREILVELKLRYLDENSLKDLKKSKGQAVRNELEPACGSWCPRRARCQLREKQGHSCYVRWGRLDADEPNGDRGVYQVLEQDEESIYLKILDKNDYVRYAYTECPQNAYDAFAKALKDFGEGEDTFKFTDKVLGMAMGLSGRKDIVSKARKKYEKEIKPFMRREFLERGE